MGSSHINDEDRNMTDKEHEEFVRRLEEVLYGKYDGPERKRRVRDILERVELPEENQ